MINKDFTQYTEAFELKQLEFDEPCMGHYSNGEFVYSIHTNNTMQRFRYAAPLYSQAFRWFREKYGIGSWIHHYFDRDKGTFDYSYVLTLPHRGEEYVYDTHEEAELACLKKLIKIVKEGNK
jgi:hypothetical protein